MSVDISLTRDLLNIYLKDLARIYRKLSGKTLAEIILVGGAAILMSYNFRDMTTDVDAVILASSAMKDAIRQVSDMYSLPIDWLNGDFKNTSSYTEKLREVSVYYKTLSSVLEIRLVKAEYLIAMKLKSGRRYKFDQSDIAGILMEHKNNQTPISLNAIQNAVYKLYGNTELSIDSINLLNDIFVTNDYQTAYNELRKNEMESNDILIKARRDNPDLFKKEPISNILNKLQKMQTDE